MRHHMIAAAWVDNTVPILIAFIGGGGVAALVTAWADRRHKEAEATDLITASAERIIERLERIIERLELEKSRLEAERESNRLELDKLRDEIRELRAEIQRLREGLDG